MNRLIEGLNQSGTTFVELAVSMFWQSSLLVLLLLAVDAVLRHRVRAVVRYGVWMLLLVKLLLPPSLWLPTGVGQWIGATHRAAAATSEMKQTPPVTSEARVTLPARVGPHARTALPPTHSLTAPAVPPRDLAPESSIAAGAARVRITASGLALAAWLLGMAAWSVFLTHRSRLVSHWISRSVEAPMVLRELLGSCRAQLGLKGSVGIKVSPDPLSPAVCGVRRPVILIPERLVGQLSLAQWWSVLLHELAHIQRQDVWVNYLQAFLQIVYFYNPLIWWAQARIRQVREQAVDETVLVAMGKHADEYPATLLVVARYAGAGPRLALGLVGILESGRTLETRIRHILDRPCPTTARLGKRAVILILSSGLVVIPMARGGLDTPGDKTPASQEVSGAPSPEAVVATKDGAPTAAPLTNSSVVRVMLVDAETGKPVAKARVVANMLAPPGGIQSAEAVTDDNGQCRLKIAAHDFTKLGVTAYADGYSTKGINLTSATLATSLTLKLARAVEFIQYEGKVLAPDGQPASGVEGAVYQKSAPNISLSETGQGPLATLNALKRVEVGSDGTYSVITTIYDEGLVFLGDAGYIRTSFTNLAKEATITLKPWARVEGTLRIGQEPGARQGVDLRNLVFNQPEGFGFNYRTETDAQGRFRFERVPPGPCEAARRIPSLNDGFPDALSHITLVEARAGETSHADIGGAGRPVLGKIRDEGQAPATNWNRSLHALVRQPLQAPPAEAANLTHEQRLIIAHERDRAEAKYYLEFQPDGSFRVEDVPPGTYRLVLNVAWPHFRTASPELRNRYGIRAPHSPEMIRRFGVMPRPGPKPGPTRMGDVIAGQITNLIVVAEPPRDRPSEPLDLGTLTLQPVP